MLEKVCHLYLLSTLEANLAQLLVLRILRPEQVRGEEPTRVGRILTYDRGFFCGSYIFPTCLGFSLNKIFQDSFFLKNFSI